MLTNELKWLLPKQLYEYEAISSLFHMKIINIPCFRNLVACIDDIADSMKIQTRRRTVRQLLTEIPLSVFDQTVFDQTTKSLDLNWKTAFWQLTNVKHKVMYVTFLVLIPLF